MVSASSSSNPAMDLGHRHSNQPAQRRATTALKAAVGFWYLVTLAGQLVFVAYIVALYGGALARGNLSGWNAVMPRAYVPGDTGANLAIGVHLLLAALVMLGGTVQLLPWLRARAPAFHRWNGRVYVLGAVVASLTGLFMMWTRGTVGGPLQHVAISLNAVFILVFAGMAVRQAMLRDVAGHRRWALRLFLAVSGVWFFRVGLMFWIAVHGKPVGFDPVTFTGPFLDVLAFAQYLLPLSILEGYLRIRNGSATAARLGMALVLVVLSLMMALGIGVATLGMWLPRM